ncbi:hypothetical protein TMES_12920 [Thalassospira mesophila]|uniref:Uncharacterized protein n=1 Tax=Thalassospira mesophila TaxID=1293891 RepID=A0A1Y2L1E1_9PROT|nr:hypothetical protein TMES_12920 [Thalassospira mesophila]
MCECGELIGDKPDLSSADDRVHIRSAQMVRVIIISIMAAAPVKQGWEQGGKRVSASLDMCQILSDTFSDTQALLRITPSRSSKQQKNRVAHFAMQPGGKITGGYSLIPC